MKRVVALALALSLGRTSFALAGESLLQVGTRHVEQLVRAEPTSSSAPASSMPAITSIAKTGQPRAAAQQAGPKTLQTSGLRRRTKMLIALGIAAGLVGGTFAIDGGVENNTPSTLGTRRD
ncbi:MAG: hypothetical protein FJW27_11730 [Acidimicrobiia bacterium]|nr:hypothetical protein [Acidimicrobiia bacterium]